MSKVIHTHIQMRLQRFSEYLVFNDLTLFLLNIKRGRDEPSQQQQLHRFSIIETIIPYGYRKERVTEAKK